MELSIANGEKNSIELKKVVAIYVVSHTIQMPVDMFSTPRAIKSD